MYIDVCTYIYKPYLPLLAGGGESGRGGGVSGYVVEAPSLLNVVRGVKMPAWDCGQLVVEMLYHYASQGDVQMAVTCIIVLGDRLKVCIYLVVLLLCRDHNIGTYSNMGHIKVVQILIILLST